jgi:hypothetical protein
VLKVLHGPVNVGNQPWVLSRNERALGVKSDLVVNYNTWLGYSADRILTPLSRGSRADRLRRLAFGVTAPLRYDVLHYYFGRSFLCWDDYGAPNRLWFKDLMLAKKLGRKVFMTLQGCDARLSDRSSKLHEFTPCKLGQCQAAAVCRSTLDAQRRRLIETVLPHADRVFVLNPELARFVPNATFLPYASVDLARFTPAFPKTDGPIRVVHAPSDPLLKGSAYVIAAIEKLRAKYPIEFTLVQGMPHEEALKVYQHADLVIDQLLFGWYGGLAVEVMAMGKPVACYIRESDLPFVPTRMARELPVLPVRADTLESDLESLLSRRHEWPEHGRRSLAFAKTWHDPHVIARAMIRAYRNPASEFSLAPVE